MSSPLGGDYRASGDEADALNVSVCVPRHAEAAARRAGGAMRLCMCMCVCVGCVNAYMGVRERVLNCNIKSSDFLGRLNKQMMMVDV